MQNHWLAYTIKNLYYRIISIVGIVFKKLIFSHIIFGVTWKYEFLKKLCPQNNNDKQIKKQTIIERDLAFLFWCWQTEVKRLIRIRSHWRLCCSWLWCSCCSLCCYPGLLCRRHCSAWSAWILLEKWCIQKFLYFKLQRAYFSYNGTCH